jgi:hypothetical protein
MITLENSQHLVCPEVTKYEDNVCTQPGSAYLRIDNYAGMVHVYSFQKELMCKRRGISISFSLAFCFFSPSYEKRPGDVTIIKLDEQHFGIDIGSHMVK